MTYSYFYDGSGLALLMELLPMLVFPSIFGIVGYVLSSLGRYTLAQRRGIHNAWLSWIPVADSWILGSLSDQYRYVARGENRSKRKSLLILGIIRAMSGVVELWVVISMLIKAVAAAFGSYGEAYLMELVLQSVLTMAGVGLVFTAVAIAYAIIYYMALYDVYKSTDPGNCVLFLVLSLIFNVTEPFFLFFSRNKDGGMPPRKDQPAYTAEPWQEDMV